MAETTSPIFREHHVFAPAEGDTKCKYHSAAVDLMVSGSFKSNAARHLGLNRNEDGKPTIGYFVGLTWLDEKEKVWIGSKPKIDNLNYWRMFTEALGDSATFSHIQEQTEGYRMIYGIDMDAKLINCADKTLDPLPLLYFHFVQTVKNLVRQGLRKGYRTETKSLQGKIKGKVLVGQTLKQHHLKEHRMDRVVCKYQIYTTDTDENRYLKAALNAVLGLAGKTFGSTRKEHSAITSLALANLVAFETVEDKLPLQVPTARNIGFYRHYHTALRLAEMILKRRSQQISGTAANQLPPFYLNLPLLFEIWVFTQLKKRYPGNTFIFQFEKTDILCLTSQTIIDAKYKPLSKEAISEEDRAQIFVYARKKKVKEKLGIDITIEPKCLIIYPVEPPIPQSQETIWGIRQQDPHYSNLAKQAITIPLTTK